MDLRVSVLSLFLFLYNLLRPKISMSFVICVGSMIGLVLSESEGSGLLESMIMDYRPKVTF